MSSGKIDKRTEAVARVLSNRAGQAANYPWALEGGGFVPAWAMHVIAAVELIKMLDTFDEIRKIK